MVSCYHIEVEFTDPAFGHLTGRHAGNMWRMLCRSQKDKGFQLNFGNIFSDGTHATADWEARYVFSRTGRRVHNQIKASFEFRDGLIWRHTDHFSLYNWSKQAFGATGLLIGWTPFFRKKLQHQTRAMLDKFETNSVR